MAPCRAGASGGRKERCSSPNTAPTLAPNPRCSAVVRARCRMSGRCRTPRASRKAAVMRAGGWRLSSPAACAPTVTAVIASVATTPAPAPSHRIAMGCSPNRWRIIAQAVSFLTRDGELAELDLVGVPLVVLGHDVQRNRLIRLVLGQRLQQIAVGRNLRAVDGHDDVAAL